MKDTYRYKVLRNGVVISKGTTKDFMKRAAYIKSRMPDVTIKKVGGKVTMAEAELWLKAKRREAKCQL